MVQQRVRPVPASDGRLRPSRAALACSLPRGRRAVFRERHALLVDYAATNHNEARADASPAPSRLDSVVGTPSTRAVQLLARWDAQQADATPAALSPTAPPAAAAPDAAEEDWEAMLQAELECLSPHLPASMLHDMDERLAEVLRSPIFTARARMHLE